MTTGRPRGWHRPVSRLQLVVVALSVLLAWLALMGAGAWLFWTRGEARLALHDQPVTLRLPAGLRADAAVSRPITSRLRASPVVPVHLDQSLPVRFEDALSARVALKTVLPVNTAVRVNQLVAVDTVVQLAVPVVSWLPPVPVTVPVRLQLPVTFDVPVHARVPLDLDVMVSGQWPESLSVPLKARWLLRPQIDSTLRATLLTETAFALQDPVAPLPLHVPALDMRMPVRRMALVSMPATTGASAASSVR